MIGTIPSVNKTFEVISDMASATNPVEGKIYYDKDERLFVYSTTDTRSNPSNGYFPIWNGKSTIITKFSIDKRLKDVTPYSISTLANNIDNNMAADIRYRLRKSMSETILNPPIKTDDNMFTQIIKSIISQMNITMVDLVDMCNPRLDDQIVENYFNSLNKISMMRMCKWDIWLTNILHLSYVITVYSGGKESIRYSWPSDIMDTGIVKYSSAINPKDDPLKRIIKVIMVKDNITKATLKQNVNVDEYTINNLMTVLNSDKPLSAQIFSRFMNYANLSFTVDLFDVKGNKVFTYKEGGVV